jgi:hypothetical protein
MCCHHGSTVYFSAWTSSFITTRGNRPAVQASTRSTASAQAVRVAIIAVQCISLLRHPASSQLATTVLQYKQYKQHSISPGSMCCHQGSTVYFAALTSSFITTCGNRPAVQAVQAAQHRPRQYVLPSWQYSVLLCFDIQLHHNWLQPSCSTSSTGSTASAQAVCVAIMAVQCTSLV